MKKSIIIIVFFIISLIAFVIYNTYKLPQDIESKGIETAIPLISLLTTSISLIIAVLTLVLKIVEMKTLNKQKSIK